jgi:putative FmdB family regulatory protein
VPIYSYECTFCKHEFDEIKKSSNGSGKTSCVNCGNVAFKIPAIFNAKIFKKREFADGTSTPDFVNTPSQEKAWMKSEGIVYDRIDNDSHIKSQNKRDRERKSKTAMELAFFEAYKKANQGFKLENLPKEHRKTKKVNFAVGEN